MRRSMSCTRLALRRRRRARRGIGRHRGRRARSPGGRRRGVAARRASAVAVGVAVAAPAWRSRPRRAGVAADRVRAGDGARRAQRAASRAAAEPGSASAPGSMPPLAMTASRASLGGLSAPDRAGGLGGRAGVR